MSGRQVYQQAINDFYKETTIDISEFSVGTYLVQFITSIGETQLEKLLIHH
jgi:hypothetical protein